MTEMTKTPDISDEVLEELLKDYEKPEDLLGPDGIFKALKKRMIEKALGAELSDHLGYEKCDRAGHGSGNSRNGASKKTVKSEDGEVDIAVPRDRAGSFEPQLVKKGQTRIDGFDDKVISMYARGMSVREIQGHLKELYGVAVILSADSVLQQSASSAPLRPNRHYLSLKAQFESPYGFLVEP